MRLARARDRAAAHRVDVEREADRGELGDDGVDLGLGHVGDDEVLQARDADVAADALGEVGDGDHLVAGDQPEVDGDADVDEAGLLLLVDAEVVGGRRGRPAAASKSSRRATEPRLDALAHALGADVVDHELEARLHPRDAVAEVVRPGARDRAEDLDRLVLRDEDAQVARDPRHRREPAADAHGEALAALVDRRRRARCS